ncbi:MAG: caspase family protein [Bryobacteraceae bacterium]|jgi:WD40 repeat protein
MRRRLASGHISILLLWACVAALHAQTAEPPMLRIETGMHTAMIKQISVDAAERFLVTGSDDKTVRVWELATGRLLQTIRPPAGTGNEGKVDAVAISPDGKTIAAGGWTGCDWEKSCSIYLFDRESGVLRRRVVGLASSIQHLAYSPDGRLLFAGLGGENGVRLYKTTDYYLAGSDADYGFVYGAAFSPDSRRLVTTSFDGFIRLYDVSTGLRLLRKEKAAAGGRPFGVAFSPDASRVAVGYHDAPCVDVLAAGDLSILFSRTAVNGNLMRVAWSRDGSYLFAGGTYGTADASTILRWNGDGGEGKEFIAAGDTIMDLIPLRNGRLVFDSADPAFGILDQSGSRILWRGPPVANFRDAPLYASADGLRVGFGYVDFGKSPAVFSAGDRSLSPGDLPSSVSGPLTTGLNVTDWQNSTSPTLGGTPLKLKQYEKSRSLAIAPDQQSFALGAEWHLRLFDRRGEQKWETPVPGVAWAVNIPGDGRTVIAAFADGTIRWYRIEDGKELLAFFPAADHRLWVMWSPSGYYDASPGGEDLIGWQVNNGHEAAADFYPASRFRSLKYRPDVVSRILSTHDENEAVRLADAESGRRRDTQAVVSALPPVVRIVSPSDGAEVSSAEVALRYSVRSASGDPVTGLRILLDGRPLPEVRGVTPAPAAPQGTTMVTIPARDCELSVIAENRNGASEAASIRLHWRGSASENEQFTIQPKLYVLAIGISAYPEPYTLHMAARDATDFVEMMKRQNGRLYRDVETKLLTDAQATRDNILDGLDWIQRATTQHDVAMIFLSGHGANDTFGTYYFMSVDSDAERLKRTGLEYSQITETVRDLAGKVLVFADTCHSGNIMGGRARGGPPDINALINELASAENGAVVFAASTGRQVALERDEWGNGAFTKALLEGLAGGADYQGTGRITVNMLDLYISERVKELTNGAQTPSTTKPQTIADFPIAVR